MTRRRIQASEQQLGYYRRYRTRHGDVLRMVRMQADPAPEPIEPEGWAFFIQVAGGFVIMGGLFLALWFWLAVAAVAQ